MNLFSTLSKENFLADVWQKKPHLFQQAMCDVTGIIDGNELAGLACEPTVESRIIFGYEQANDLDKSGLNEEWRCEQGVFEESRFSQLPEKNWTLLVQGLDQWMDEARDILASFSFLPQWRLEDIMASYAPIGGGVGPHFDYYDVFLIQVSGTREWRLGQWCNENSELQNNDQVKLLAEFSTEETHHVKSGDVLYIPAGKAHWGIASSSDCITLSVGFRAPSQKELLSTMLEDMVDSFSNHQRYKDSVAAIDVQPSKINHAVQQQLHDFITTLSPEKLTVAAEQAFGKLVTEPRYSALDEPVAIAFDELNEIIKHCEMDSQPLSLYLPVHSRLAFSEAQLFVNGEAYVIDEMLAQAICEGTIPTHLLAENKNKELLHQLLEQGDIELLEE